jgi:hypothetical protein
MLSSTSKYETVRTLGEGGYGKALLVRAKASEELFVMKEVRLSSLKPRDRDDALREAQVLASLNCSNIVRYVDSFQERGCFYIVMEYADGGDLAQKIEGRGRRLIPEKEILHDFIQVALAIKYIHDRKILHRDLKAENVFLMADGAVKLGDFGIAKVLERTFQLCHTQIGTPYYLSPEICNGKPYNSKTDIWSLGCLLYELCTLKHPFDAASMNRLLTVILRGKYHPVSVTYSRELRNLIGRMLMKDPAKRPTINQILGLPFIKQKLSAFLDEATLEYEMSHTTLHGRRPLAAPTVHLKPQTPLPPAPEPVPAAKPHRRERTPVPKRAAKAQEDAERHRRLREEEQRRCAEVEAEHQRRQSEFDAEQRRIAAQDGEEPAAPEREPPVEKDGAPERKRLEEEERRRAAQEAAAAKRKKEEEARLQKVIADRERRAQEEKARQIAKLKADHQAKLEAAKRRREEEEQPATPRDSQLDFDREGPPKWAKRKARHDEEEEEFLSVLPGRRKKAVDCAEVLDVQVPTSRAKLVAQTPEEIRAEESRARNRARKAAKAPLLPREDLGKILSEVGEPKILPPSPPPAGAASETRGGSRRLLSMKTLTQARQSSGTPAGEPAEVRSDIRASLREALDLPSVDEAEEADPGFDADDQPSVFYIGDKEIRFPVGQGEQGKDFRIGAMRNFLVREIGRDALIKMNDEIRTREECDDAPSPVCDSLDPGLVVIARQLYVLEHDQ